MTATIPDALVLIATIAAMTAMTIAIPTAVLMNEMRRPSLSMLYHVPNDEIRNHICKNPDMSNARWYERPTDSWKLQISVSAVSLYIGPRHRLT